MRLSNTIYYLLSTLIITTLFAGCSAEEEFLNGKEENKQEKVEAAIILSVNAPKANTRAGETTGLPGTSAENKINNLAIFIVGDNKVDTYQIECSESESGETSSYVLNIETLEGSKKIYVGANMSQAQIDTIKNQSSIEKAQAQLSSSIEEVTGSTNGYLMTGQATDENGSSTIQIEANKFTMVTVALHRVVSKVLVTCVEDQKGYTKLTDGCKGYIRRENVKYALETTNRKFYYFVQPNNEDPNYSLKDMNDLANNFWSYNGDVKTNGATAIKTDDTRLNSSNKNPYNEGLNCLENTFTIDDSDADAQKVVTYLKIAAKFTPSSIDGNENLTEAAAISKLKGGTFYTYKKAQDAIKHMCYSSIAIAKTYLISKGYANIKDTDFTTYEGGWQEYVSYVNSPVFSSGAQLKRNNYYIANIKGFTAPVVDKTIEVNTVITEWVTKGTTTVEIETGK